MQKYQSKPHYLMMEDAKDSVKNKTSGCYLTQETKTQENVETKQPQNKKKQKEGSQQSTKTKEKTLTKLERKHKYNELKREMKQSWTTKMESEGEDSEAMMVPSHFRKYTIKDRKIVIKQPNRSSQQPGESYNGPENAKKIDLADEEQEPRPACICHGLRASRGRTPHYNPKRV